MLATFAGGCYWCMEPPFHHLEGVSDVISGYIGGKIPNPTYEQVCSGRTGHFEAIQVTYDPQKITYEKLLDTFWRQIDPTDGEGQFADKGSQYLTAIFFHDDEQKRLAEKSKEEMIKAKWFEGQSIRTQILPSTSFFPAEDYHQKYYMKNPVHYNAYKIGSGRAGFLKEKWKGR